MLDSVPEFAKARHWTSCEVNGQIYVWYHCDGTDPEWSVPEQPEISKGEWVYRGRTEHFINAHIQVSEGKQRQDLSLVGFSRPCCGRMLKNTRQLVSLNFRTGP